MARWARSETSKARRRSQIEDLLAIIFGHEPWMSSGACASTSAGDAWYPALKAEQYTEKAKDTTLAKRICRTRCPVREECLGYALRTEEPHGIWGGLDRTARERLLIRPLQQYRVSAMDRVQATEGEEPMPDPDGQPTCVCTPSELETEKFFPGCPRHRPPDPPWTGSDDWS